MIGHAVRQSDQYVPVSLEGVNNYRGYGKFNGSFNELEAGCFVDEENKTAYLVLLNKTESTYHLGTIRGIPSDQFKNLHLDSAIMLTPRQDVVLEKALADEEVMTKRLIIANEVENMEIKPYSLTRMKIRIAE